jgi:hypothetical protein
MDLRGFASNYFSKVIIRAGELLDKKNFTVILDFEPLSLINFLSGKGWQYKVDKIEGTSYQVYFFRNKKVTN